MSAITRPNSVTIERRVTGVLSPTGSPIPTVALLNRGVPARLEPGLRGELDWLVEGATFVQAAALIIDGISPAAFAGLGPGESVTVNGIAYLVAENLQAAFPDLKVDDRITDEDGTRYLALAVTRYYVTRTLQAQILRGRSW